MEQKHFAQLVKGVKEMRAHMAGEEVAGIHVTTLNHSAPHNPHQGSSFDDFLKEDGIYDTVHATALNRVLAEQKTEQLQSVQASD